VSIIKYLRSGFTLIELLIVIAVLGVLAAVTVMGIDPIDKINAANDTKIQRDTNALSTAMEAYAVANNGVYAADQAILVTSGDLKTTLTAPTGYSAYTVSGGATGKAYSQLKSKKYVNANTPNWVWCSASGKAGATANPAGTCP